MGARIPNQQTQIIELHAPRPRSPANPPTHPRYEDAATHTDYRKFFVRHYARIRATCLAFEQPGLAVFAFTRDGVAWRGTMCLASRPGELRAAVVGRHSMAALHLGDDPTLSLRHLLYVVEPPRSLKDAFRGEVRFRIMDLETGNPPVDEEGRTVASLTAESPVFLTCRGYVLLAFVTGDPTDWPPDAADAWDCIPERIFVEERVALGQAVRPARRFLRGAASAPMPREPSVVRRQPGPSSVVSNPLFAGPIAGTLALESGQRSVWMSIDNGALQRGVLIGRYERCTTHGRTALPDGHVSRVHLLLLDLGGTPWAIDLSSTYGTYIAGETALVPITAVSLADPRPIWLGGTRTTLVWRSRR